MDIFKKFTTGFVSKVIDKADVFIVYLDKSKNVSICNTKVESLTSRNKEEIIGNAWFDALYHDHNSISTGRQMFQAIIDDSTKYKRPNNFESLFTDKENKERLISWSITPILSESEDLEGMLLIGNDITELVERQNSFRKIDETLKDIFSNIREYAIYVVNLDGKITYFGMGSEVMFGWQKREIIFKQARLLHPKDESEPTLSYILEQVNQFGEYETEVEMLKKDDRAFPVILTVTRFLDSQGRLTGYIFIAKDITERKKLEYQVIQSEKLAAIGQLVAGITHDINNPLFVISGRLEIMLQEKKLDKELKKNLMILNEQAERIKKLVDQLLKFSRKSTPKFISLNVNEVIENILPLLAYHKLSVANINILKNLQKDISLVKGDLNQLQEVFINLCINAYQAMSEGGSLAIKTCNLPNRYVEVRISDTGKGIPEENLKNIFMPFFSTKKEGTGLGLSICYNIIKSHSGTIEIDSEVNKGTTFIIRFPFVQD
ncbi:MAG: PAS domain-containing protein [Candidatus Omnitrophica bacterium]|nr:PAS domain-containing protein [Candidatus Omnitrophota bacterium]